ncbi:patched family domain-containing protein [Ditylenchus destructor]|uniref:Patched family domain-containing protein n=1 Tax=Ditylenchus destructor TaxID=166010 RepID=A0AAD4NH70_9BILA|nr:patched family domain-containing protein [Ditylenchus destructor]
MAPPPANRNGSPPPPMANQPVTVVAVDGGGGSGDEGTERNSPPLRQRIKSQARPFGERRRSSILVGQRSLDLLAMNHPEQKGPRFVLFIIRQYRRWGYFIADHDWKAMLICLIISGLGLWKVVTTPQQNDITGYSPYGARARTEYSRYQDFFSQDGPAITIYVFALAKDGGSMLRDSHLKETLDILDDATDNVTMYNPGADTKLSFGEFCRSFCSINEPVRQFYNGLQIQNELAKKGQKLNGRLNLSYPISSLFGRSLTLQQNFFGIEFFNDSDNVEKHFNATALLLSQASEIVASEEDGTNSTIVKREVQETTPSPEYSSQVTNMKSAKIIVLQFRAEHEPGWTDTAVKKYEMDMVDRFDKNYKSDNLKTYVLSKTYVEEEMVRAGISLLPYLTVGFLIMSACSVISVVVRAMYLHQHSAPKILLAVMACVLPFMSCATALGLMFLFGVRFASILCVDSSYLMIHEWQRVIKHARDHPNRKNIQVGYRISEVLSEIGPAILISTLTNFLADGVGAFTSSPEITLLCAGNLISMVVAYIYQMTFYAGLMSLVGRYEIKSEKIERQELQASMRAAHTARMANGTINRPLTRQQSKYHDYTKHAMSSSIDSYVNVVARKAVAFTIIVVYFLYLAFSIWGITRININLTTQKLFTADSPLLELDKLRVEYQVPHFTMATVFINKPGNFGEPARLRRMNSFVEEMEAIPGSWGAVGTQYFVRDFLTFESSFEVEDEDFDEESTPSTSKPTNKTGLIAAGGTLATPTAPFKEEDLKNFVEWPEYSYWGGFLKINNETDHLEKFFFTAAYHGQELSIWTERGKMLNEWRRVVDKYSPEFDASVFHEDGVFLDLIDNMPSDTWQSVLGTLLCMGAVCFVFLNSLFTVVIASSCVLSISAGILGILSWWHIDLDPITMAAMIISIGFSVDIPAHVSYHYYQASVRESDATPQIKLVNCLSSVAFPALQAALSTTLCVSSLLFVHIYMAEVFVKTMVLCVVLCNLHGLVFLPAFLILFDSAMQLVRRLSNRSNKWKVHQTPDRSNPDENASVKPSSIVPVTTQVKRNGRPNKLEEKQKPFNAGSNSSSHGSSSNPSSILPQRHMSRISSHTQNSHSSSTVTDRPELDFPAESTEQSKNTVNPTAKTPNGTEK